MSTCVFAVQEPGSSSEPQEKEVALKNVSPLQLTPRLETSFPFYLGGCHGTRSHVQVRAECDCCRMSGYLTTLSVSVCLSVQELSLDSGAEVHVMVTFDPSYCSDKLSRREERQLAITFREHTHKVRLCCCVGSALSSALVHPPQVQLTSSSVPFLSLFPSSLRTSSICHQRSTFPIWTLTPKRFVCVYIHVYPQCLLMSPTVHSSSGQFWQCSQRHREDLLCHSDKHESH